MKLNLVQQFKIKYNRKVSKRKNLTALKHSFIWLASEIFNVNEAVIHINLIISFII